MADSQKNKLLKVLFIHGYRQNALASRQKTGAFRKMLKKYLDIVYIDAPNEIPSSEDDSKQCSEELGWWFSRNEDSKLSFNAQETSDIDDGHDLSIDVIKKTFKESGPFDGIIGFSQGATMAAHICALSEKQDFGIRFAILCAGFKSASSCHEKFYENQIPTPTLHVYGDTDKVIPKEMSVELMKYFTNNDCINHNGGHYLPATSTEKQKYIEFLSKFQ